MSTGVFAARVPQRVCLVPPGFIAVWKDVGCRLCVRLGQFDQRAIAHGAQRVEVLVLELRLLVLGELRGAIVLPATFNGRPVQRVGARAHDVHRILRWGGCLAGGVGHDDSIDGHQPCGRPAASKDARARSLLQGPALQPAYPAFAFRRRRIASNVSRAGASNMWGADLLCAVTFSFPHLPFSRMRFSYLSALLAVAASASCGGADSTTPAAKVVSRVAVTGTSTMLNIGQIITLTAVAFEASGAQIASPATATWSSSAAPVAAVDQTGKVTGVKAGSATITADIGGVKGTLGVNVNPAAGASKDTVFTPGIAFSPPSLTVSRGATVIFALGFDGIGHDVLFATKPGSPAYIPVTSRQYVARTFPTAGDFAYTCPTHPEMNGVIIVQ